MLQLETPPAAGLISLPPELCARAQAIHHQQQARPRHTGHVVAVYPLI